MTHKKQSFFDILNSTEKVVYLQKIHLQLWQQIEKVFTKK